MRIAARNGAATFIGFITAGAMPLAAYLVPVLDAERFGLAAALAGATLFAVGAARAPFTRRSLFRAGAEMLVLGAGAGAIAFGIGRLIANLTGGAV